MANVSGGTGVPGGIEQYVSARTNIIDVTESPYNADNTGASDASSAIQSAITAAPEHSVVYLPAGTYRIDTALQTGIEKRNITIRGAGPSLTKIAVNSSKGIIIGTDYDYAWPEPASDNMVTGTRTKGTADLVLESASGFTVGTPIRIAVENQNDEEAIEGGATPVIHTQHWPWLRRQIARVTAVDGNVITISPPLHFDCTGLETRVNHMRKWVEKIGLEDLEVDCTDSTVNVNTGVQITQAIDSWVTNVQITKPDSFSMHMWHCLNTEIRRYRAQERRLDPGPGGGGIIMETCGSCLVEDSIFYDVFPVVEVIQGSSGNVIGYNVCDHVRASALEGLGGAYNGNHGPHCSFNLFEGNIGNSMQQDGYFGSESDSVWFRNYFHGTERSRERTGIVHSFNRMTRNDSILCNLLGRSGLTQVYNFGYPNMGNGSSEGTCQPSAGIFWETWPDYLVSSNGNILLQSGWQEIDEDVALTTYKKGNYNVGTGALISGESLSGYTVPESYYRTERPEFIPSSLAWPAFNPLSPPSAITGAGSGVLDDALKLNPAGYRFIEGEDAS